MADEQTDNPLSGSDEQTSEQTPDVQAGTNEGQVTSGSEFTAGGKDFSNLEDLRNAYSELQKGFTQKSQEYSDYRVESEKYREAMNEIKSDPELVKQIRTYLEGNQARQGLQAPAQRGLSSEEESRIAKMELNFETQELQKKHPDLTGDDMAAIYRLGADLSEKWNADVPLENVYVQWASNNKGAEMYQKGLKDKESEIKKARGASTSQPVAGGEKSKAKFNSRAPGGDRRKHIDALMREKNIDMSGFD